MRVSAAIVLAAALGLASTAQAMPLPTNPVGGDSSIAKIAYGCGPGFTRGPYGHCRPMYTCPPGWHSGPYGYHCFPN
jgi:hypothetical protein